MFAEFNRQGALPPYIQLANYTRALIVNGAAQPGVKLPSVRAVSEEAGVSPATVDRAWAVLKREGLLRGVAGVGVEVVDQSALRADRTGGYLGSDQIAHPDQPIRTSDIPEWVADRIGGTEAIRRYRWIESGGKCIQHGPSWVNPDLAEVVPELDTVGKLYPSWQKTYTDRTGIKVKSETVHTARLADNLDRDRFGLTGVAALPVARNIYSINGNVVACSEIAHAPGYELPAR
jgi:DNA-binding GntR family transcriptional regulator